MIVAEVMSTKIITISPEESIRNAADKMIENGVDVLLVIDRGNLCGILTEKDIIRAIHDNISLDSPISKVMTKNVITISPDASLEDAAEIMVSNKIKKLPVVEENNIIGIVTATNLISYEEKLIERLAEIFLYEPLMGEAAG